MYYKTALLIVSTTISDNQTGFYILFPIIATKPFFFFIALMQWSSFTAFCCGVAKNIYLIFCSVFTIERPWIIYWSNVSCRLRTCLQQVTWRQLAVQPCPASPGSTGKGPRLWPSLLSCKHEDFRHCITLTISYCNSGSWLWNSFVYSQDSMKLLLNSEVYSLPSSKIKKSSVFSLLCWLQDSPGIRVHGGGYWLDSDLFSDWLLAG